MPKAWLQPLEPWIPRPQLKPARCKRAYASLCADASPTSHYSDYSQLR